MYALKRHLAATLVLGVASTAGCASYAPSENEIRLTEQAQSWRIDYESRSAVRYLVLAKTPDDSRHRRWRPLTEDIELVTIAGHDAIRRTDGMPLTKAAFEVAPTYTPLPKAYAPFSPFSDGGVLVHSGRFHACGVETVTEATTCDGPWRMRIGAAAGRHVLRGEHRGRFAEWLDTNSGTKVYVGTARPSKTAGFVAIVDPGLPRHLYAPMMQQMPRFMRAYAERLPTITTVPMLFVSFDPGYERGGGRQGGTLPGQVFMHFYGPDWTQRNDAFPAHDVLWFFAHETGHIYQHGVTGERDASWIHEGAADLFAWRLLSELGAAPPDYLAQRLADAERGCADFLAERQLAAAAHAGAFSAYYHCGLIMFAAIDAALQNAGDGQRDIFALWRDLVADGRRDWSNADFLAWLAARIDPALVSTLQQIVFEPLNDPETAVDSLRH